MMAGPTGLEPATSGVTGRRSNQLNYSPAWVSCNSIAPCEPRPVVGSEGFEPATLCV